MRALFATMRSICLLLLACFTLGARPLHAEPVPPASSGEFIIVSGGVSLWIWEKWKANPHDNWWMNFIRAARIRIQEIKAAQPDAQITWLVFRPSYESRAKQENNDLISHISSVRDAFGVKLMWFDRSSQLVNYLNAGQPRDKVKIANFEYYGHSNKACLMFDYSNDIDSASKVWLHQDELKQIKRGIFSRDAYVKSWGCYTGESMSKKWKDATGVTMIGAKGKTQYMTDELPVLASPVGRWIR